jgi:hypothetical protein
VNGGWKPRCSRSPDCGAESWMRPRG